MELTDKILKFIFIRSRDKIMSRSLNKNHNDIKCPNCNEWFSVSGIEHNHHNKYDEDNDFFRCKCGKCDYTSNWSPSIAPVLVLVDSKGDPV